MGCNASRAHRGAENCILDYNTRFILILKTWSCGPPAQRAYASESQVRGQSSPALTSAQQSNDTGDNLEEGEHHYKMLRSVSDEPIRAIIYSHEHYVNGAQVFVDKEAERGNKNIMIIGHPDTNMEMVVKAGELVTIQPMGKGN